MLEEKLLNVVVVYQVDVVDVDDVVVAAGAGARIERLVEDLDDTARKVEQTRYTLPTFQNS